MKLNRDRNFLYVFLILSFLLGCSKNEREIEKDLFDQYEQTNYKSYSRVYKICNDSINAWRKDSLIKIKYIFINPYKIDSSLIFNSDKTRCFTTVNVSYFLYGNDIADMIYELGGALINGRWYFMLGASWPIVREYYQDSIYAPLTFKELSIISHKEVFPNFRVDSATGKYIFNEAFFEGTFYEPFDYICKNKNDRKACCDSVWLAKYTKQKQEKLNAAEVEQIKLNMAASVRPTYEPYAPRTWWERFWHPFQPRMFGRDKEDDPFK